MTEDVSGPLPYDVRIGVTGHRVLSDPDATVRAVDRLLNYIATTLNHASAAPLAWSVFSPLANGADRIVAERVLAKPNAKLQVITPLPLDDYRADFGDASDRHEFERLLTQAASVHELGTPHMTPGAAVPPAVGSARDIAYFHVGEHVVDACEILICIWNGRPANGVGGTADIVQYALQRERTVLWIHADQPDVAARLLKAIEIPDVTRPDALVVRTGALPKRAKELSRGYHQQAAYAADPSLSPALCAALVRATADQLRKAASAAGLPAECIDAMLEILAGSYVRADQLAMRYQQRYTRATNAVLYLAASAVTVAVAQVLFFPARAWLILLEVAAMLGVFGVWWYSRKEAWHEKWLHDRYLAEQLRAAAFLTLLGPSGTESAREDPLPFYPGPHQWLEWTVGMLQRSAERRLVPIPFDGLKRFLLKAWLLDQQEFHAGNAKRKSNRADRRHRIGFVLFGATLFMAVLHLLGIGHPLREDGWRMSRPDLWITFLVLVLPVWAASIHAATAQLELHRIASRSDRMARMLDWLAHRAERATSLPELRDVALEAANLMGNETREWWALLSFQDVTLHV